MGKLSGRVAVITGGASGIGKAIALLFAAEGAAVGIIDLTLERARAAAAEIAAGGATTAAAGADVADEGAVRAAFAALIEALGPVDILVNNAGMDTTSPVDGMATEMFDRMMAVHMRGTFLCTREVLPAMKAGRWGRIINISSQLAHKGSAGMAHYCAAKAAIMGFTRALAYEVARDGITANTINPGPIRTPLLDALPADWLAAKKAELPIGRFGEVGEIAPVALLLACDEGSYFVGASLNPNGGDYMI
ncbi:SDR family NAD(P)-dependent oxidoreductase [Chelatococcus reniformis]|uniref:3-oxoacyl-ACP reductase n=1 Tax=Chelatococcus reniformis TaxID=1494448 RepID=A0A916UPU2_9HYPH|nr:SDR family NAD(P)-dependent oxidoreductase [Chelatococcus reniformis]GGC80815.1 3-oxoacyl-ACP reductase [Chelatococcus reniformis]